MYPLLYELALERMADRLRQAERWRLARQAKLAERELRSHAAQPASTRIQRDGLNAIRLSAEQGHHAASGTSK